jgi:hypothetical protein
MLQSGGAVITKDLNEILEGWKYEGFNRVGARKIIGLDGKEKGQLRIEMGVLQGMTIDHVVVTARVETAADYLSQPCDLPQRRWQRAVADRLGRMVIGTARIAQSVTDPLPRIASVMPRPRCCAGEPPTDWRL